MENPFANLGDYFTEPDLSDVDMGVFFQDVFQFIGARLGAIFQSETWTYIWQRIVEWFGWAYLVPKDEQPTP
ncbi:MAG: hypothetical protein LBQ80_03370 [Clostridium sp.]|jgi:hypothetical protein|nr:hypothetical protein [Clostridium sp.]